MKMHKRRAAAPYGTSSGPGFCYWERCRLGWHLQHLAMRSFPYVLHAGTSRALALTNELFVLEESVALIVLVLAARLCPEACVPSRARSLLLLAKGCLQKYDDSIVLCP